jgi:hypothetical protein
MKSASAKRRSGRGGSPARPRRGSARAASWVHLVLNPLLFDLSMEVGGLRRGDLFFRRASRSLEFLRPLREYRIGSALPAYEDFVRWNPVWRARFEKRDRIRDELERAAAKFFETLVGDPKFRREALRALADYRKNHRTAEYPGGSVREAHFPEVVAEQLVNGVTDVPEHYAVARFWEGYQHRFEAYRREERAPEIGRRARELLGADERMARDLAEFRFELCEKYDIPAVPYEVPPGV